jgi:enamine deaminase RidA (YjgF/YER057c/UK114 family)
MKRVIFSVFAFVLASAAIVRSQSVDFKNPPELSKPNGYSHVVIVNHGKLVVISGQTGLDGKGEIQGDFAAQARQAFRNLKTALSAAGASPVI